MSNRMAEKRSLIARLRDVIYGDTGALCDEAADQLERLQEASRVLAILALQSDRYGKDGEFRDAVDDVLAITRPVVDRAVDEILTHLDQNEAARRDGEEAARSAFGKIGVMLRRARRER